MLLLLIYMLMFSTAYGFTYWMLNTGLHSTSMVKFYTYMTLAVLLWVCALSFSYVI